MVTIGTVVTFPLLSVNPVLGYDTSTKALTIATEDDSSNLRIYSSPDGVSLDSGKNLQQRWRIISGPVNCTRSRQHLSFCRSRYDRQRIHHGKTQRHLLVDRKETGSVSGIGSGEFDTGPSLALDSSGTPDDRILGAGSQIRFKLYSGFLETRNKRHARESDGHSEQL